MSELEIAQEKFYRATGFLAPGKDEPAAMCGQMDFNREEVRRMLWSAWRVKDTEIAALLARVIALQIDVDHEHAHGMNYALVKEQARREAFLEAKKIAIGQTCEKIHSRDECQICDTGYGIADAIEREATLSEGSGEGG